MSKESAITWTEATWSPVIGCTKVSQGCKHCYAEREVTTRWSKNPKSIWFGRNFTDVLCRPEALSGPVTPCAWKKPRRIFVCPRADLFHEAVPYDFITAVFTIMAMCPRHTFQILTKRPERMKKYLQGNALPGWPFPNVWLGTSIEDQATADERIPLLLETPAAVRWISAEPLVGPVTIFSLDGPVDVPDGMRSPIDWVVSGGESGPNARPMHPDWIRRLCMQCGIVGVKFLHKQNGEWLPAEQLPAGISLPANHLALVDIWTGEFRTREEGPFGTLGPDQIIMGRVGKAKAGRLLDGVLHDAYPEVRS